MQKILKSSGFSLIEILISLALIATGILGCTAAIMQAVRESIILRQYAAFDQQLFSLSEMLVLTADLHKNPQQILSAWQTELQNQPQNKNMALDIEIIFPPGFPAQDGVGQVKLQWQKYHEKYQLLQNIYFPAAGV